MVSDSLSFSTFLAFWFFSLVFSLTLFISFFFFYPLLSIFPFILASLYPGLLVLALSLRREFVFQHPKQQSSLSVRKTEVMKRGIFSSDVLLILGPSLLASHLLTLGVGWDTHAQTHTDSFFPPIVWDLIVTVASPTRQEITAGDWPHRNMSHSLNNWFLISDRGKQ